MIKTTKDGSSKKSLHHAIDDLPPLYVMKSNEVIREQNTPSANHQVWIGSLRNSVKLPNGPPGLKTKEFGLSKQVDIDVKSPKSSASEHQSKPSKNEETRQKQQGSNKPLTQSIVVEDADRIRYSSSNPRQPTTVVQTLFKNIVVNNKTSTPFLFSSDIQARDIVASILTNPLKLSRFIDSLVDLMTDPNTSRESVQNIQLLILLLKKLMQDNIQIKQTRYDIEIVFNETEVRKKNRQIETVKRKLAEKQQEAKALADEYEGIIPALKENIQLMTGRKKQQQVDFSSNQHNTQQQSQQAERYADQASNLNSYHEEASPKHERGWTFSIKK